MKLPFRLSTRIAALSTMLVLASISAATSLFYAYSASVARGSALADSEEAGRVMATILEERVRGVLRLTFAAFASGSTQTTLEHFLAEPSPPNTAAALTEISGRFTDVIGSDPFIASIYLDTPKGAFYSFVDIVRPGFSLADSDLLREAAPHLETGPYWAGARKDPIFADDRTVVPMVLLYNLSQRPENLHLVLSLRADAMQAALAKSLPDNAAALLLDGSGNIVFSSARDSGELEGLCTDLFRNGAMDDGKPSWTSLRWRGTETLVSWKRTAVAPWILVDARSLGGLAADLKRMREYAALLIGLLVAAGLFLSAAIARGSTRQLHRLEGAMRRTEDGDLAARFEVASEDEIAWLGRRFNSMLDQIETLVAELNGTIVALEAQREATREEQAKKRRAELSALQAQINPHFLYNTLNTIIWMAHREGVKEIAELAGNLGSFFRLSLNRGIERIALADELEQVRSYLALQKARYGEAVAYRVEAAAEVASIPIVKLVVQPLVENSIEHGIMGGPERGSVTVEAFSEPENGCAVIRVDDDGVGMDAAALKAVNRRLERGETCGAEGYGIYNVNERLRLEYGERWGLRYGSRPGGGLRVEIRIPLPVKEDGDGV